MSGIDLLQHTLILHNGLSSIRGSPESQRLDPMLI